MESNHILSLPIVKEENICLPLVISAVSNYWGIDLPFSESKEIAKKYPNIKGSIMIEGIELAERHGLASLILNSTIKELKKLIDMGIPPIVILPGILDTVQHASLILGYDDIEKTILHYFPEPDKVGAIPEKKFDEQWSEDDKLLLVIVPPDILSEIHLENKTKEKSNRLCFNAEKLRLQGKLPEAITTLQRAIEINQSNSTALCLLAGILNDQNSPDAVQYYKKSIKFNPRCYLAYRGLGNFYLKAKDYPNAEKYYTKAIEINQNRFSPIYKNRGLARLEQNKKTEAKKDFEKYLEQMPNATDRSSIIEAIKEL
ncbi:MAG: tetratricopeptide repeat protein [Thaumarchaeota archaeon]|nr:MAG: tetratricopeptide repeat protein [Nitrososphaerota archaeon]TLX82158.1 MAG: tetratricopeptide repeat protein [Nitrososphaerota archaeon]